MSASYPNSAHAFGTKSDGPGNTILAAHINDLQLEVTAIEQDLIAGVPVARGGTGNTSLTANRVLLGNGSSAIAVAGAGTAGQILTSNGASAPTFQDASTNFARTFPQARLSLTTGNPFPTADVTAATMLYYALYGGNQIGLYTGTSWQAFTIVELSIAVPATTNQMYDVFVDYNSGTPILALTAWTNDSTRATALTLQDGVLVKTGSTGQRYVGCMRTTAVSGQTEDSFANRFVWNYYHQDERPLRILEATDSWAYTTATWRQARGQAANQVAFIVGVAGALLKADVLAFANNAGGATAVAVAVGLDSVTAPTANQLGRGQYVDGTHVTQIAASLRAYPAEGYHYAAWLEYSAASGTTTWYGDNGDATLWQAGLQGTIRG